MIKAVIFDFDGVLADSHRLKRDTWFALFARDKKITREYITDILARIPETRYDILREIFSHSNLHADQLEQQVAAYAEAYGRIVQEGVARGGVVPEMAAVIPKLAKKYSLYVNSLTPEIALVRMVEHIGFSPYVKGVYGRPADKDENMKKIFTAENIIGKEAVFVGDADSDYAVALAVGCHFIGVPNESNGWTDPQPFSLLKNGEDLEQMINNIT